jgi:DNA-binding MarR family transcriptional regulator
MERLNRAIKTVHSSMEKIMRQAAGADDLTLMHWCILVRLLERATCEQVHLRAQAGITAPHLTKLLDDLVARDLVRRDRCPRDRRKFILSLTQAGRTAGLTLLNSLNGSDKGSKFAAMSEFHRWLKALMSIADEAQWVGGGTVRHA